MSPEVTLAPYNLLQPSMDTSAAPPRVREPTVHGKIKRQTYALVVDNEYEDVIQLYLAYDTLGHSIEFPKY